ncbi:hypothetical protein FOCC_FOCC001606 [Frankliniella occidentalis]|nr:hypothetical protein FOCC_FOCC001606 [Frankliniella occidentalis]
MQKIAKGSTASLFDRVVYDFFYGKPIVHTNVQNDVFMASDVPVSLAPPLTQMPKPWPGPCTTPGWTASLVLVMVTVLTGSSCSGGLVGGGLLRGGSLAGGAEPSRTLGPTPAPSSLSTCSGEMGRFLLCAAAAAWWATWWMPWRPPWWPPWWFRDCGGLGAPRYVPLGALDGRSTMSPNHSAARKPVNTAAQVRADDDDAVDDMALLLGGLGCTNSTLKTILFVFNCAFVLLTSLMLIITSAGSRTGVQAIFDRARDGDVLLGYIAARIQMLSKLFNHVYACLLAQPQAVVVLWGGPGQAPGRVVKPGAVVNDPTLRCKPN